MLNNKNPEKVHKFHLPAWAVWYILFLAIIIFWHLLMREYIGDSVIYFSKGLDTETLPEILKSRYQTWSSRVFIEAFLYVLARNVILWKICNIAMYALFAFSLLRLTDFKYPQLTLGLWIIYPVSEMSSAGWIATYMNYFWPLSTGTYALIALYKIYHEESVHPLEWISFSLATLFATNVEQLCVFFICILAGFGIEYYIIQKSKKGGILYIFQWIITLGNTIFILISPGNSERTWREIGNQMPDFGTLSMIDKGVLGVVVTMKSLITGNVIFLLFVSMIFILGIINQNHRKPETDNAKRILIETCYTSPFILTIALTIFKNTTGSYFGQISTLFSDRTTVNAANWHNFKYYIPFILDMLIIMAIIIALLNLFDDFQENIRLAILFITGLLTRIVLGFSPTLYASHNRTFLFFEALLIFDIVHMYAYSKDTHCQLPKYTHKICSYLFTAIVVLSFINNTIAISATI